MPEEFLKYTENLANALRMLEIGFDTNTIFLETKFNAACDLAQCRFTGGSAAQQFAASTH